MTSADTIAQLQDELSEVEREKALVSEVTIRFKTEADANEEAFGRLKEQLSAYSQRIDALQVCATVPLPGRLCLCLRVRALPLDHLTIFIADVVCHPCSLLCSGNISVFAASLWFSLRA
jgi:hypothetical protein